MKADYPGLVEGFELIVKAKGGVDLRAFTHKSSASGGYVSAIGVRAEKLQI